MKRLRVAGVLVDVQGLVPARTAVGRDQDVTTFADGHQRADVAFRMFCYRVKKYIGGYAAAMGGVDAVFFTGGIGENRASARAAICQDLNELGIELDSQANETARGESEIGAESGRARIWVVPTNEELIVARQAYQLLQG